MLTNIQRVEIELQSKCNRHCNWCFNREYKRDESIEMPEDLFLKIINELKENNFDYRTNKLHEKIITFNRFCEPMYNIDLLVKRSAQIKELMPEVIMTIGTNGDYLTAENLLRLKHLHKIKVSDYDNKGRKYWEKRFEELKILKVYSDDKMFWGTHVNINKIICDFNWSEKTEIEDRAGYLNKENTKEVLWRNDKKIRTERCLEPKYYLSIDYNGSIVPCCHMRSDIPMFKKYVFGNVKDNTIVEILNSEKAKKFTKRVFEDCDFPEPCKTCNKYRPSFRQEWVDPTYIRETEFLLGE